MKNRLVLSTSVFALLALTGCQSEYLERSDFVSEHGGDAVARNIALQTVDPWPSYVHDDDIVTSSKRQSDAIRKYHNKHAPEEAGATQLLLPVQGAGSLTQ